MEVNKSCEMVSCTALFYLITVSWSTGSVTLLSHSFVSHLLSGHLALSLCAIVLFIVLYFPVSLYVYLLFIVFPLFMFFIKFLLQLSHFSTKQSQSSLFFYLFLLSLSLCVPLFTFFPNLPTTLFSPKLLLQLLPLYIPFTLDSLLQ